MKHTATHSHFCTLSTPLKRLTYSLIALSILISSVSAATLPEHSALSILIIADEVNPHRLSDEDLTQPEDLAPALNAPDSPLNISSITTTDSQCIDAAIEALSSEDKPDVVLYFAHRAALHCDGSDAQPELTGLIENELSNGLGVVMLHHGWYVDIFNRGAKEDLLTLLGAKTNSIAWDTNEGQRVLNVAPGHFISSNGLNYAGIDDFTGTGSVAAGSYDFFDNIPDELYSDTTLIEVEGEQRTPVFATGSQGERLLGYVLQRQGWSGRVVAYQPGEYQPNALDDHNGPNFQILVNAIYFSAVGQ